MQNKRYIADTTQHAMWPWRRVGFGFISSGSSPVAEANDIRTVCCHQSGAKCLPFSHSFIISHLQNRLLKCQQGCDIVETCQGPAAQRVLHASWTSRALTVCFSNTDALSRRPSGVKNTPITGCSGAGALTRHVTRRVIWHVTRTQNTQFTDQGTSQGRTGGPLYGPRTSDTHIRRRPPPLARRDC